MDWSCSNLLDVWAEKGIVLRHNWANHSKVRNDQLDGKVADKQRNSYGRGTVDDKIPVRRNFDSLDRT